MNIIEKKEKKYSNQIIMWRHTLVEVSLLCCSVVMLDIRYEIRLVRNFHLDIYLFLIDGVMIKLSLI